MPQQVDFYILSDARQSAELFACRLTQKVYGLGERVLLLARSEAHAAEMDSLLWTYAEGSFIPHCRLDRASGRDDTLSSVAICHGGLADWPSAVVVNLSDNAPAEFAAAPRVAEIVAAGDAAKSAGRERFAAWKAHGVTPTVHNL